MVIANHSHQTTRQGLGFSNTSHYITVHIQPLCFALCCRWYRVIQINTYSFAHWSFGLLEFELRPWEALLSTSTHFIPLDTFVTFEVQFLNCFLFFLSDIILNFRTSFVNKSGQVVYEGKLVALNYMRGWFLLDLLAAIPFDFLYVININTVSINMSSIYMKHAGRSVGCTSLHTPYQDIFSD